MLTVGQLKNILAQVPDDAIVVASDPDWNMADALATQLIRNYKGSPFDGKNVLFIDIDEIHGREV